MIDTRESVRGSFKVDYVGFRGARKRVPRDSEIQVHGSFEDFRDVSGVLLGRKVSWRFHRLWGLRCFQTNTHLLSVGQRSFSHKSFTGFREAVRVTLRIQKTFNGIPWTGFQARCNLRDFKRNFREFFGGLWYVSARLYKGCKEISRATIQNAMSFGNIQKTFVKSQKISRVVARLQMHLRIITEIRTSGRLQRGF